MHNRPKKNAYNLLKKRKIYKKLTLDDLYKIIEDTGFSIIEYKKYNYSKELRLIINKLDIEKEIQEKNAFYYKRDNLKFIFINEDVPDEDRYILLSHEIAHIFDERIAEPEDVYTNIQIENYANEFSHYLNNPSFFIKAFSFLLKKPLLYILALVVAITSFTGVIAFNSNHALNQKSVTVVNLNNLSTNMYYVTSTGTKYHKSFCKHVKYKTNIQEFSLNEAISEGYLPCLDCIGSE